MTSLTTKQLLQLARKSLNRQRYKQLKEVVSEHDFDSVAQYAIISFFNTEIERLNSVVLELESQGYDLFFVRNKLLLLPSKLQHLRADFSEERFHKVYELFSFIEKELDGI